MKNYGNARKHIAAGVGLTLAVIFITACNVAEPSGETRGASVPIVAEPTDSPPTAASPNQPVSSATEAALVAVSTVATPTQLPATPPSDQNSTAQPPAAPSPASSVQITETTVTLPTYPVKDFLMEQIDPVYNIPVYYFNRAAYEATAPQPTPTNYIAIVLENPYLRLTFLPELGGRLYSAYLKTTGQEIFYHNPVVKPSRYGVLQPYEANWWLATGGMEWAYPTQEHGYRFGVAWSYEVAQTASSATITLSDTAPDRVGLAVTVTLPVDQVVFTVEPRLVNNTSQTVPIQLWANAALTLGSGSMSLNTQFVMPGQTITIHSRGESGWSLPGERQQAPWPQVGDTNLSHYNEWANYLGFFVPNQEASFLGAYNPDTNLGLVRLAPAGPGSHKLFAFGRDFPDRSYTDDNSQYFEIWGGANAGFWPEDDLAVPAGDTLGWQETWWPLAELGGLTWATNRIAIDLTPADQAQTLTALVSQSTTGTLEVATGDTILLSEPFSAEPVIPKQWTIPATTTPIKIQFKDEGGSTLLVY
ncbi:MAG: DUF5107 domain-containing protein [Anaerolineales bacterium]|nr:DUF5107 domain-containing protein [Anaerolineales bacterium]